MLFDVRTYTCRPGMLKKHFEIYARLGKPAQVRHLGEPFAYLQTETGNVNQFMHIWAYESAADREKRRAAMQAESAKLGGLDVQENRLMKPVDFAPMKR